MYQSEAERSSEVKARIEAAVVNHPGHIAVFFVRHKDCLENLPPPKTELMLFKKELLIQEVMYALFCQIQIKGLCFYAIKRESNNRYRYVMLQSGSSLQKIYEDFGHHHYLTLIYHNENIGIRKIHRFQKVVIRFTIICVAIWVVLYVLPTFDKMLMNNEEAPGGQNQNEN